MDDVDNGTDTVRKSPIKLDHATLRTSDLEGTRDFLEAVLDLKVGYRPAFSFPGYWLYADGEPIVHVIPGRGGHFDRNGETIDHVGFRVSGYDRYRDKLTALGVRYSLMDLTELDERRLFIRTPTGVLLELVFRGEPASTAYPIQHPSSNAEGS
jgi:catechol 2,3-dioxygenase-like lactoylglutathione lyase family enzyme